jgi:hypothetical protein
MRAFQTIAPGSRLGWFTCNPVFAERLERQGETTTAAACGFSQVSPALLPPLSLPLTQRSRSLRNYSPNTGASQTSSDGYRAYRRSTSSVGTSSWIASLMNSRCDQRRIQSSWRYLARSSPCILRTRRRRKECQRRPICIPRRRRCSASFLPRLECLSGYANLTPSGRAADHADIPHNSLHSCSSSSTCRTMWR